ncbi:hypothetical protein ARMSODRAFT_972558 [Armillaria solidipes]|uniref:Uncharacterized protein n=1 Tax=Armillaria solidipes TaxID=1076256 RepID=A0A2H3C1C9_9AGAR|nr:hypothetical protein ARMSODRAFT_972558 [Armillaria solidipes]
MSSLDKDFRKLRRDTQGLMLMPPTPTLPLHDWLGSLCAGVIPTLSCDVRVRAVEISPYHSTQRGESRQLTASLHVQFSHTLGQRVSGLLPSSSIKARGAQDGGKLSTGTAFSGCHTWGRFPPRVPALTAASGNSSVYSLSEFRLVLNVQLIDPTVKLRAYFHVEVGAWQGDDYELLSLP